MAYKILDSSNLQSYLLSLPDIKNFFHTDTLIISEIGDGNLNFVFLVTAANDPSKQLIVKQAVPYLRCVGESYPLSKERMTYEIRSLKEFARHSPHIPKIYYSDEAMSVIVMEYLAAHVIMRKGMIEGVIYPNFVQHITTHLAQTLFKTSSLNLNSSEKRHLIAQFIHNSELCRLTEDFVFTAPFMEDETNADLPELSDLAQKIHNDVKLKTEILHLKYKFMNQSDALIHGDLHTGSIMLNQKSTYVIDSEFAFVGPMGFDVGALIANLVMSWVSHQVQEGNTPYAHFILESIEGIWNNFKEKFLLLWSATQESALVTQGFTNSDVMSCYQQEFMHQLLQDSIGFAGCKIIRRQFGIAGVEDIRGIHDDLLRERANRDAVAIGVNFIKKHNHINSIKEIITILKEHYAG